jgi:hypothetical protein
VVAVAAEAAVERKEVRQVPEWHELEASGPAEVEKGVLKSTKIAQCYRHKQLDCLRRDTTLTERGPRQKDRGAGMTAASMPKWDRGWGWGWGWGGVGVVSSPASGEGRSPSTGRAEVIPVCRTYDA